MGELREETGVQRSMTGEEQITVGRTHRNNGGKR